MNNIINHHHAIFAILFIMVVYVLYNIYEQYYNVNDNNFEHLSSITNQPYLYNRQPNDVILGGKLTIGNTTIDSSGNITVGQQNKQNIMINSANGTINIGGTIIDSTGNITLNQNGQINIGNGNVLLTPNGIITKPGIYNSVGQNTSTNSETQSTSQSTGNVSVIGIYNTPTNTTNPLQIGQIAIYDTNGNQIKVSPNDVKSSPPAYGTLSSTPIDGTLSARSFPNIFHGMENPVDPNTFYEIGLPQPQSIGSIVVYGRSDCCQERMASYKLAIKDTNSNIIDSIQLSTAYTQKYTFDGTKLSLSN